MTTLIYDGSFDGLFTAIFEAFEYRYLDVEIASKERFHQENIFAEIHEVITQTDKSERVLKKIEQNLGKQGVHKLLKVFLSEDPDLEKVILSAVKQSVKNPEENILENYADTDIMKISKICKSVDRESHRMTAFVRFEKMQDGIFFSKIDPDFNILPLIRKHFSDRYQDQKWMIYDLRRNYGILYNLESADFFYPDEKLDIKNYQERFHNDEKNYQTLWQRYFTKTNIVERKNLKLHIQHVPKRYWKYLTEKW
ncbi:TIGR03915 family putative DNA repair protein [Chryseobacterium tructae]|uniref:TIGR03915 family putative DNA repair protein n=1 Tax=Chryseobacterium tructae TaxID=1037380 RepID=A0ABV7XS97_9FLAO|nr:TIGR03915 family putative DNA repair protein [Chryseobacterium tructae]MDN3691401.1 TIGR03915 family putative DNA repair protein [Chryseobacterium tructae]